MSTPRYMAPPPYTVTVYGAPPAPDECCPADTGTTIQVAQTSDLTSTNEAALVAEITRRLLRDEMSAAAVDTLEAVIGAAKTKRSKG